MHRKRKPARPSDPMVIARRRAEARAQARDPASWGVDREAVALPANAAIEAVADPRGRIGRARRRDVFDMFHDRGALSRGALEAVRRLQDDIAVLHRTHAGGGDLSPRVDVCRDPGDFTQRRLRAGWRVAAALELAGVASARLLRSLCEADVALGRAASWREVAARETGETLADAQGATLRAACENLAGAYAMLDRRASRAASQAAMAEAGSSLR